MSLHGEELDQENRERLARGEDPIWGRESMERFDKMLMDAKQYYQFMHAFQRHDDIAMNKLLAKVLGVTFPGTTERDDFLEKHDDANTVYDFYKDIVQKSLVDSGHSEESAKILVQCMDIHEIIRTLRSKFNPLLSAYEDALIAEERGERSS